MNFAPLFILLFLVSLTAYGQQERVAIINTLDDYDSISVAELTYLTNKLRETAVKILPKDRFGVMTTESIVAFLGSQERLIKVCKESSCLADLGRQVSADYVAQGRIGRFSNNLTIMVELYSVKSGVLMDSFTGHSKDIYGFLALLDEKAPIMFKNMLATAPTQPPQPEYTPPPPQQQEPQQVQYQPPPPQQQGVNMEQRAKKVQLLIDNGFAENEWEIKKESFYLSHLDKTVLYYDNKKGFLGYALLNTVPGFGLGSYIQGDIKSGVILSVVDVVGSVFMFHAITNRADVWCSTGQTDPIHNCDSIKFQESEDENEKLAMISRTSLVVLGASRIAGWIFSFVHKNKYNKALKEALNINDDISLSIDPLIVPRDGMPAVGLAFNVRY